MKNLLLLLISIVSIAIFGCRPKQSIIVSQIEDKPKYFFIDLNGNIFYGRINPIEDIKPDKYDVNSIQQLINTNNWDETTNNILLTYEVYPIKIAEEKVRYHKNVDILIKLLKKNGLHFASQFLLDDKSLELIINGTNKEPSATNNTTGKKDGAEKSSK
jgi:hypothetical protein